MADPERRPHQDRAPDHGAEARDQREEGPPTLTLGRHIFQCPFGRGVIFHQVIIALFDFLCSIDLDHLAFAIFRQASPMLMLEHLISGVEEFKCDLISSCDLVNLSEVGALLWCM